MGSSSLQCFSFVGLIVPFEDIQATLKGSPRKLNKLIEGGIEQVHAYGPNCPRIV